MSRPFCMTDNRQEEVRRALSIMTSYQKIDRREVCRPSYIMTGYQKIDRREVCRPSYIMTG